MKAASLHDFDTGQGAQQCRHVRRTGFADVLLVQYRGVGDSFV
jgi:hypothetical protein